MAASSGPNLSRKKLLFLISEAGYFLTHRLSLAQAAQAAGYDVIVATAPGPKVQRILDAGFKHISLTYLHRSSLSPLREILALQELIALYKTVQPDLVHQVAMKPVLYGTLAAQKTGVPRTINAFGGLGYLFSSSSWKARGLRTGIRPPMRWALGRETSTLILQNADDLALLKEEGFLARDNVVLIPGSGVDTTVFAPKAHDHCSFVCPSTSPQETSVAFVGRLLWDKGIQELSEAALKLTNETASPFTVYFYGDIDPKNPLSLTEDDVTRLSLRYPVVFKGPKDNIAEVYRESDIAVLPSYREGMPKSLLEAASCGLPLITTDVPGCREVVAEGVNGLLVPPRDVNALTEALATLCLDPEKRRAMGEESRLRAKRFFSQEIVNKQTLALYEEGI